MLRFWHTAARRVMASAKGALAGRRGAERVSGGGASRGSGSRAVGRRPKARRFGFGWEGLEERRVLAHSVGDSITAYLEIFVNGTEVAIPANVGVTSTTDFSPRTEDATGKLFIGGGVLSGPSGENRLATLDDFFDIWRQTNVGDATRNNPNAFFSSTQLLGNTANATNSVFMTVNGSPNTQFENYVPEDGDHIVLSYGPSNGAPTLAPLPNVTLLAGSPLVVSLDGFDPNGDQLTYTVTSNSNPSLVTPTVSSGNPFIQMEVAGFGSMVFELFQDKAPRAVQRVTTLANQEFYDGLIFHRVMNNFVIQGGDPLGTGAGGSSLGNFDDQFHVDLQHNRTGLLSYAKSSDDTNNSQFFITEGATRHLDFNHTIFGVLIEGESVRDAISNVATDSSNRPLVPVTIDSVRVVGAEGNRSLLLKAPVGGTGTADLTVTATDAAGNTTSRTFTVTVAPDTVNGGPFLNDIPAQRTVMNQPLVINLTSQDVEGNAVTYTAAKGDALASTVSVNATTGAVTATPPTGFVGSMLVRATVAATTGQPNDTQDKTDVQVFAVTVAPLAPTGLDLLAADDSGASSTDNVTNDATPSITVSGVTTGATVKLYDGTTLLGQATASGTSVTIVSSALSSGARSLRATQTVSGIESDPSAALTVTVDTAAPTFTSTAPTTAKVNTAFTYDAATNEEGSAGLVYSLVNAPTGVTIDGASGIVSWTPTTAQLGAANFQVVATDLAGNSATQNLSLTVADVDLIQFRLSLADSNGAPVTTLVPNQTFTLRVTTRDLRSPASGVFSAYLDVLYTAANAAVDGPITYGAQFPNVKSGSTTTPGLIDELGAVAGFTSGDGSELLVASIPMRATAAGTIQFTGEMPDVLPAHNVLLLGRNPPVPAAQVRFVNTSVTVGSTITATNDTFNVNEDAAQSTLTVLSNDTLASGAGGTLTVSAVGTTSNGGTVSVAPGGSGVRYQPAANYFGTETFTYTTTNGTASATATVTVQVQPVNDPPTATADTLQVNRNSSNNILNVLANDLFTPDATETLRVTAVSNVVGGTASIGPNGTHVVFTPTTGFSGTASFNYTISDPSNATSSSSASITVVGTNNNPTAANDTATVAEDSSNTTVNVLANDSFAPDTGETLTVTAVGTPSQGGTVTIGTGGANVRYTPKANFVGSETFTYTIGDGNGGTATATATMTVTNVNDPPTATADATTVTRNSSNSTVNVLANDSFAPDTGETLTVTAVGTPNQGGTATVGTGGANVRYSPAANFVGTETFTYTISDGNGGTSTSTVTVTVSTTNSNPTAANDTATVAEDSSNTTVNVLANDSSAPDVGETLTVTGVGTPSSGGTATVGTGGANIRYTPAANFFGTETFTYTISDGNGGSASATVTMTVTNVNDIPTAANDTATVAEDSSSNAVNVLANDSFAPDTGETLRVTAVGTPSQGGTATVGTNGANVLYTPKANFFGTETFTYTISDGNGGTATATATITVTNVNDPPTAVADSFTIGRNTTNQTLNVLANDGFAPDPSETLTIQSVGATSNGGTVTVATNGLSLIYTPATNYTGTETFSYVLRDATGATSNATVTVNVSQFLPSSLSGVVYLDLNRDGVRQSDEPPLVGVTITLNGPTGGSSAQQTRDTDSLGRYEFTNLAPGGYTIGQQQPEFLLDGAENVGSQGGSVQNNAIVVTLAENTQGVNNNFAEERQATHLRFRDFLARSPRDFALAAVDSAGNALWTCGWNDVRLVNVSSPSTAAYRLDAVNASQVNVFSQPAKTLTSIKTLQTGATGSMLRFDGAAASYNFQPVASGAGGEGEGEPDDLAFVAGGTTDAAAHDAVLGQLVAESTESNANSANGGSASPGTNASAGSNAAASGGAATAPASRSSLLRFSARRASLAVDRVMAEL